MIFPLGLTGVIIIVAYTKWITRNPLLCLIAPGIGFGILMVMGTHFVLTGQYSWTAFFASLVPSFLVSDLLLLNQLPDAEADKTIGRKHVVITSGKKAAAYIYSILLVCTYLSIIAGYLAGFLPAGALLALVTIVLAVPNMAGAVKNRDSVQDLIPYMGKNVVLILLTNVLLAVGIFAG
jgi:1,4-dihydroxy-2-naphthoate octaprenyltransferase